MDKVLLVGEDFALLAPRAAVLAKMVSNVTCCNPSEFAQMASRETFALVVLCHSLRQDELLYIASEARRRWPQSRLLHLCEEKGQRSSVEQRVDAVETPEPRKLARTVATMLKKTAAAKNPGSVAASVLRKTA